MPIFLSVSLTQFTVLLRTFVHTENLSVEMIEMQAIIGYIVYNRIYNTN